MIGVDRQNAIMARIIERLSAGVTRAEDLARDEGISSRTVYRYIARLQVQGQPIEGAAGVGYMLRPARAGGGNG